jgi:hypothetical protein
MVVCGAVLKCTGSEEGEAVLAFVPTNGVSIGGESAATVMCHLPIVNIPTFELCNLETNLAVQAATAAAGGAPTPAPCIPIIELPWVTGEPTVPVGYRPALTKTAKCFCQWGGEISIVDAGMEDDVAAGEL